MARITTQAGLRTYILQELGDPVITVPIAPVQLNQIIDDCVQIYQKYSTGEGNYLDFLAFTVTSGTSAYSVSAHDLASVVDFNLTINSTGINTLFTSEHNLLWEDWVVHGNYPTGQGGQGMALAGYEVATQYLEDIRDTFNREYKVLYSDARQELLMVPTPNVNGTGLLQVYRKEQAVNLYNDDLVKRLCVAKSKMLAGTILSRYAMQLPEGGTINGEELKSEGKEEWTQTMEDMIAENPLPGPRIE